MCTGALVCVWFSSYCLQEKSHNQEVIKSQRRNNFIFLFFKNMFNHKLFVPLTVLLVILYFTADKIVSALRWPVYCVCRALVCARLLNWWLFFTGLTLLMWLSRVSVLHRFGISLLCKEKATPVTWSCDPVCFTMFLFPASTTTACPDCVDGRRYVEAEKIQTGVSFTITKLVQ